MSQNGKGDTSRPLSVPAEEFARNWERIFGSGCPWHRFPGYGVQEWEQSRQFDSDHYGPVERGEVRLVPCQTRHAYHIVPASIPPEGTLSHKAGK